MRKNYNFKLTNMSNGFKVFVSFIFCSIQLFYSISASPKTTPNHLNDVIYSGGNKSVINLKAGSKIFNYNAAYAITSGDNFANFFSTGKINFLAAAIKLAPEFSLTLNIVGEGSVTKDPDQPDYNNGSIVALTANPAPGHQFMGWSVDITGAENPLNVTIDANKSVTATFAPIAYTLTTSVSGNGSVNPDPSGPSYNSGTLVTITPVPESGYQFTGWSGAATGNANPLTLTMDGNKSVTANFETIQYSVIIDINGNGTVIRDPEQATYTNGTVVTLTAIPAAGQQFIEWAEGNQTSTTNPLTITITGNRAGTVTFAPMPRSLSITTSGNGSVSKNPDQPNYQDGTSVTLTAAPLAGQQFTGWSGAATGTVNPLVIAMDADKSVTATFAAVTYTLTTSSNGNGTVSSDPVGTAHNSGTIVTLTPIPESGYQFISWSGSASGADNPLSITMDADKSVTATFSLIPPSQYALTIATSGNGSVTKDPNQTSYLNGTSVTLTATPGSGHQFTGWSGAVNSTTNPLNITIDTDKDITATFIPIQYTLTIANSGNGSVIKNPDQASYESGATVTLTATPQAGQQFTGWSGAINSSANPLTITMDADKSLTATFAPVQFTLAVIANGSGTVTKNPNQATYSSGTSVSLTAVPGVGQQFTGWSGAATGTVNPLSIIMNEDKSVTANFTSVPYTLGVSTTGNGTVSKSPNQASYTSGTSVTLTATPTAGQQFTGWSGDASGNTNPLIITMTSNKYIIANFTQSSTGIITNITTTTGRSYLLGQLNVGVTLYTDRTYTATSVPAILDNAPFIRTPNADKGIKTTNALSFTLTKSATVYVAYDPRATVVPAWLSSFQKLTIQVGLNDPGISHLVWYSKNFPAGKVTLGGNLASPAAGSLNNYLVAALLLPSQFNLTVTTSGSGTVTKNPDQANYINGTSVILTATPLPGNQFTGWSGAVTSTVNPLTVTMDANKSINATFAPIPVQYSLTVTASGSGEVTKSPDQPTYQSGTSVTLTAIPAAGQQFSGWSGDATGTVNPLTIVMDINKSVIATFAPIPQYNLTVTIIGNGIVTKNPNQDSYLTGSSVTLTATPAAGEQFTGWSGNASGNVNPLTVIMDADKAVTATFAPIQYSLTVNIAGNGTVTKTPDQPTYASGTSVVLTAIPEAGHQFTGWSGAATGTNNPLTIVMDAGKSVTATFAPIQYSLTVNTTGNGTVIKNPDQPTYASGTSVVLTATPAAGQQFSGWSGDATGTVNPLTITMDADKSITATFIPIQYTLTLSITGNGTITKNPDQPTYTSGTSVVLTATPAAGQQFTGWGGDASGTANPLTVIVNSNKIISATFIAVNTPLISNVVVTTANTYTIGQLVVGTTIYTDRAYQATTVPAFLNNAPCIKTPMADKGNKTTTLLSFNLSMGATVYVGYDPRSTVLPAWLSSWQKLTTQVGLNDPGIGGLVLYSKIYPAGKVTLGGNLATPAAGALANYFVMAVQIPLYTLTTTITGAGTITRNPDQVTYPAGTSVTLTTTPAAEQQFMGWSGDASGKTNPLTIVMNANKSVTATFAPGTKSIYFTQSTQTAEVDQGASQDLLEYISTSDNSPTNTKLTAVDEGGNVPTWLSVNGFVLNGTNYTANSEITFSFDATNLSIGTYTAVINASSPGYNNAVLEILLTVKEASTGIPTNLKVNFQDSLTIPPTGFSRDFGQAFGLRNQDSGYTFGWLKRSDNTPLNLTKNGRKRNTPADILQATFMHMQANNIPVFGGTKIEGIWEAQVTNGNYDVTVSVGDGTQVDSKHSINVEGVNAISNFVPTTTISFKSATVTVSVADGFLTVDAGNGVNTKINYILIKPSTSRRPSVIDVNPENSSQNVSENTSISTSILNLPNGGIDNSTITSANVYLTEEATGALVASNVNGTGGGDAITLVPLGSLKLTTTYIFNITSGVKDLSGATFIPYSSSFTTGSGSTSETITAKFDKISLPNATGDHSSLTIGPDGKLYALSIDGLIKRFPINNDGTLGDPDSLYSLQDQYGTRKQTLAISLAFDPASTANNLIAWITHSSTFVFLNGPPWDGRLSKLTGPNLQNVQDVLVNLPRSAKDHVTNSIAFGPDGKLYFTQASNSAMGSADQTWNNRSECLLSASVLRLDVSKLGALPLDVKTPDGGGTYNPYATNAPLTIYASGIRNAYDLIWHSNGNLYTPTNGSAAGGNTPASVNGTLRPDGSHYNGPVIPALTKVLQTQKDFLFRVQKGGYYGHPNPVRGEYVMNGGNPTSSIDPAQVNPYPVGTMPDINYRGYAFDFQNNASPNGAIEYKSNTFNGALKGKILVVRYSQHDDIITLTPGGPDNDIISSIDGISIPGFSGFSDPLNLTEDLSNGNLYVSEYGGGKIDLLRVNNNTIKPADSISLLSDAFVRSDSYGDANYGSDTTLIVKGNLSTGGLARLSYLKFPLKNISNITSAKLRLYGNNQEDTAKINVSAFSVANDAWLENNITYNSAPAGSASPLSVTGINNVAKYYEFDVTNFVISEAAGDKIVSFLMKDAANKNKKIVFNSRQNARFKPQLLIVANNDTIIISGGTAPGGNVPAARKSSVGVNPSQTEKNPLAVKQVAKHDSSSLFSLEATPYLFEHNFEKLKLYPNPLHNKFNIQFPSRYQGNFTIEIIDLAGRVYKVGNPRLNVGGSNMQVNISKLMLKPGTYFLRVASGTGKSDVIKLSIK